MSDSLILIGAGVLLGWILTWITKYMTNQKILELVNQIEQNAGSIFVREQINGEWQNTSLLEMPAHLAIRHVCRLLRCRLKYEGSHANFRRQVVERL